MKPDSTAQLCGEVDLRWLLESANHRHGSWDPDRRSMSLHVDCLRRNLDGSDLSDRTVELRLVGVVAIALAYDVCQPDARPSRLVLAPAAKVTALDPWPFQGQEAAIAVDSRDDEELVEMAPEVQWILGDLEQGKQAPTRISCGLHVEGGGARGMMWVACHSLSTWARGAPLSLETWTAQWEAWWRAWAERSRRASAPSNVPTPPVTPALPEEGLAPFDIASFSVPVEVMAPIRVWFEAPVLGAWAALASAYPHLYTSDEDRARALERIFRTEEPWRFAREARDAWIEGRRAHVRIVGVQYRPPEEGEEAWARLVAWSFDLRARGERWYIRAYLEEDAEDDVWSRAWIERFPGGPVRDALAKCRAAPAP